MDLEQYVDYMLVWMAGQAENEYRSGGSIDGSVPYTFYLNDADGWLRDPVDGVGGQRGDKTGNAGPANILGRLVSDADPEFMTFYADRIQNMFFNDGPLSTAQSTARLQEIIDQVDQSVILEAARWSFSGEPNGGGSLTVSQFQSKSQQALDDFLPHILDPPANREDPRDIIERFRDRGVFPDLDAPDHLIEGVIQDGGTISAGSALTFAANAPTYFTLDGSDPRLPGGGISSNAILVSSSTSVTLNSSTNVRSRTFSNGEWSALNDASFVISVTQSDLRITEVNYHPSEPTGSEELAIPDVEDNDFEFVELVNTSTTESLNLNGVQFVQQVIDSVDNGISFTFGDMTLAPGERVVIVNNLDAFELRYGTEINVAGEYTGNLSNGGETITVNDLSGVAIQQFTYDDAEPWPTSTDGGGDSLNVIDTDGDYDSSTNWIASNPTPGADVGIGRGVLDLIVSGSGYFPEFIDAVDGGGIGAGNGLGYSLAGSHQLETLPWANIDTLYLEFTGDVSATLTNDSVMLTGTNGGDYSLGTITVDSDNIATIPVIGGIGTDSLVLTIFEGTVSTLRRDTDWWFFRWSV